MDGTVLQALIKYVSEGCLVLNRKLSLIPTGSARVIPLISRMEELWKQYLSSSYQLYYRTNRTALEMVLLRISSS